MLCQIHILKAYNEHIKFLVKPSKTHWAKIICNTLTTFYGAYEGLYFNAYWYRFNIEINYNRVLDGKISTPYLNLNLDRNVY